MDLTAVLLICVLFVCVTEPLWGIWKIGPKRRERAEADKAIDGFEERRQSVANQRPAAPHQLSRPSENMSSDVVEAARVVKARLAPGETMAVDLEIDDWCLDERD